MRNMVDVSAGKMTLQEAQEEVRRYMYQCLLKSPKRVRITIDVERRQDGYHATIWIPKRCFGDPPAKKKR